MVPFRPGSTHRKLNPIWLDPSLIKKYLNPTWVCKNWTNLSDFCKNCESTRCNPTLFDPRVDPFHAQFHGTVIKPWNSLSSYTNAFKHSIRSALQICVNFLQSDNILRLVICHRHFITKCVPHWLSMSLSIVPAFIISFSILLQNVCLIGFLCRCPLYLLLSSPSVFYYKMCTSLAFYVAVYCTCFYHLLQYFITKCVTHWLSMSLSIVPAFIISFSILLLACRNNITLKCNWFDILIIVLLYWNLFYFKFILLKRWII